MGDTFRDIPAISANGLTRRFGQALAVSDLSINVPRGSVYGFLGPNGAGKTTTIRMLLGLIRPDAGEVELFGLSVRNQKMEALKRAGALVETPSLYAHLTGRENLEVTRCLIDAPAKRIDYALGIVGLANESGKKVRSYSLGMRQRLGLALALLSEPDLLILDEPTNGLDPAGILEMRELIRCLPLEHGITVFLSSHLLAEVEQTATHLGIIHRGRLEFEGTLEELRSRTHTFILAGTNRAEDAARLLNSAGWSAEVAGETQLRVAGDTAVAASQINALLVSNGFAVSHLSVEQPSLESLFLTVTSNGTKEAERP